MYHWAAAWSGPSTGSNRYSTLFLFFFESRVLLFCVKKLKKNRNNTGTVDHRDRYAVIPTPKDAKMYPKGLTTHIVTGMHALGGGHRLPPHFGTQPCTAVQCPVCPTAAALPLPLPGTPNGDDDGDSDHDTVPISTPTRKLFLSDTEDDDDGDNNQPASPVCKKPRYDVATLSTTTLHQQYHRLHQQQQTVHLQQLQRLEYLLNQARMVHQHYVVGTLQQPPRESSITG